MSLELCDENKDLYQRLGIINFRVTDKGRTF